MRYKNTHYYNGTIYEALSKLLKLMITTNMEGEEISYESLKKNRLTGLFKTRFNGRINELRFDYQWIHKWVNRLPGITGLSKEDFKKIIIDLEQTKKQQGLVFGSDGNVITIPNLKEELKQ